MECFQILIGLGCCIVLGFEEFVGQNCFRLFENNYESEQSFLLADSNANLSNVAAEDNIFLINSENISNNIIDDLLLNDNQECVRIE